ncbi:hypothetical protein ACFYRN_23845 [Streptomyces sp. NPDC005227]|uniref:hypothetical protein n=1 Tax=unclassified Streptomyces TaxID=2593676 RepID=UPI00367F02BE
MKGNDRDIAPALTEIRRYPRVTVDVMEPPHAAQLVLTASRTGTPYLAVGDILQGVNPDPGAAGVRDE